jgi:uncharacterized protein (TIGR03000 family)
MYKKWLVGSVAAVVVMLALTSDASAQRRIRGGMGYSMGSGYYPSYGYGYGRGGGYRGFNNYYPGLGYSNYPGFSFGFGNYPSNSYGLGQYYPSYGSGNLPGSYYSYSPGTYNTVPTYSVPSYSASGGNYITGSIPVLGSGGAAITMQPAMSSSSTSGYTPQGNEALMAVRVPDANAEVFIDGRTTQQRGTEREFVTPPLESKGTYAVRVRWRDDSGMHDVMRNITVTPGSTARTDFAVSMTGDRTGEELAEPPTRLPRSEITPQPRPRNNN